ncbi:MAG TPA: tetratricopeptide repeat protein [Pseudomonadales bacterium]
MRLRLLLILLLVAITAGCSSAKQRKAEEQQDIGAEQWLEYARQSRQFGNHRQAIEEYQATLALQPENVDALSGLAQSYNALNMHEQAGQAWQQVAALSPGDGNAWLELALLDIRYGRLEQAAMQLDKADKLLENNWRIADARGVIDDLNGDYDSASLHYRQALAAAPENERARVCNNLGYSRMMARDYAQAIQTLQQCLKINPYMERSRNNLGLAYAWNGEYDEAAKVLGHVLESHEASNNVGYIAMLRKDYTAAERLFNKAIEQSPGYYKKAFVNLAKMKTLREADK